MTAKSRSLSEAVAASLAARTERQGECLIWTGSTSRGYPNFYAEGKTRYMHRHLYEERHGPIPAGLMVDHVCHNPRCVEVSHLRLATLSENNRNLNGAYKSRKHDLPRGVTRNGRAYRARVHFNKVCHSLTFPTVEEAAAWARDKRKELYGDFAGKD